MPAFIYGDSYGDVGNRQLAYDAARDNRYFQMLADQRARDSAAQNYDVQMRNLAQTGAQQEFAAREAEKSGAENEAYRWAALDQNANLYKDQLQNQRDIAQMSVDAQKASVDRTEGSNAYKEAYQAIVSGTIKNPAQLENFSGLLTPTDKARLTYYLQEAHNERLKAFDQSNMAAQNMNAEYQRRLAPFQGAYNEAMSGKAPYAHWYSLSRPTPEEMANSQPVLNYNQARDSFFTAFNKDKRLPALTTFDTFRNQFVPLADKPEPWGGPAPAQARAGSAQVPNWSVGPMPAGVRDTGNYEEGNYELQNPSAAPAAPPVASGVNPKTGVTMARMGVTVNPTVAADIQQKASSIPNPADQFAYIQQRVNNALQDGSAVKLAPAPAPAASSNGLNDYANFRFLGTTASGALPSTPSSAPAAPAPAQAPVATGGVYDNLNAPIGGNFSWPWSANARTNTASVGVSSYPQQSIDTRGTVSGSGLSADWNSTVSSLRNASPSRLVDAAKAVGLDAWVGAGGTLYVYSGGYGSKAVTPAELAAQVARLAASKQLILR